LDASLQANYPRWFKRKGKERIFSIANEIAGMDKYWNDLIYSFCDGDAGEMRELKKFDIMDFFGYIENKSKKDGR
jgi:hypothetical protein